MFWYIVICILMLYPLAIRRAGELGGRDTKPLALAIACGILWFFMAMRDVSVGVDTKYYSYVFTQFEHIPFGQVFTAPMYATESETWAFDFEPGYRLLNKFLSLFTSSPQAITVLNSTLIILLLYRLIRKDSPYMLLSVWLYLTLGVYQTEMNVTRNAIAILIVYNGFSYIRSRMFWKYLLVCLFGAVFHVAVLVLIPVYFLVNQVKLTPKLCLAAVAAACLVGVLFPYISPYIRMVLPSSLDKYFRDANQNLSSVLVGMFNGGLFLLCYWQMKRSERDRVFSVCAPGVAMLVINLCFFGLNIGLDDAARMAALFGPYAMILIPRMIAQVDSPVRRNNLTAQMAVISGVVYVLRMCINNIGGTMPYAFFW